MSWQLENKLKQLVKGEDGTVIKDFGGKRTIVLVYPNTYHVGMSNLGLHNVYRILNERDDTVCERAFLPERRDIAEYKRTNTPILSVESQRPLSEFDIIAFSIAFENDVSNIKKILELSKIPFRHPALIVGGAAATLNPGLFEDIFDEVIKGDFEIACHCEESTLGGRRSNLLHSLVFGGLPVRGRSFGLRPQDDSVLMGDPSAVSRPQDDSVLMGDPSAVSRPQDDSVLMGDPSAVSRPQDDSVLMGDPSAVSRPQDDSVLAHTVIWTKNTEFGSMHLVEMQRGCPHACKFCAAPVIYRPFKQFSKEGIIEAINIGLPHRKKIGLIGGDVLAHPSFIEIAEYIHSRGGAFSPSSVRADRITGEIAALLKKSGHKTVTLAPETGSETLRKKIGKNVPDENFFHAAEILSKHGIKQLKLYFMIGLPGETEEDVVTIKTFVQRLFNGGSTVVQKVTVAVNPFVPKRGTPFASEPFAGTDELKKKISVLKKLLNGIGGVTLKFESPISALHEYEMQLL